MAPLVTSSMKSLEEHLFRFRDFGQIMGNISKAFQLATTKEEATKKVPHESLQDVTTFKG
jgi:hypothetical protein